MTAIELLEAYAQLGPQEPHIFFHFLADRLYDVRLQDGGTQLNDQRRLCDATDFEAFLRELGDAMLERSEAHSRLMRERLGPPVEQERWR